MKALTLWQPWASLIAWGEKQYETRSWRTDYRGPLAIHASIRFTRELQLICWKPPFVKALIRQGLNEPNELPLGAVLCVVDLVEVGPVQWYRHKLSDHEITVGNYSPDRYAWKLENLRVLTKPISVGGHQQLWNWPVALESLEFKK